MIKCIVCGSNQWKKKYSTLSQCKHCGFVRAQDKYFKISPSKLYAKKYFEGDDYRDYGAEKNALQLNFYRRLNDIREYKKRGKLLEIGSAYGYFLEVAKKNFKTCGIDVNKDVTKVSKKNSGAKVFTGDFLKTSVGKDYDVICMFDVIEHLKNPQKFIEKIYKILKPGGILMIETGDIDGYLPKLQKDNWRLIKPPFHLQYFSKKTLSKLLLRHNFIILKNKYTNFSRTVSQTVYRLGVNPILIKILAPFGKNILTINTYDILITIVKKPIGNRV